MATVNAIGSNKPIQVSFGGTGDATLTSNAVLVGQGTSAVSLTNVGTNGQILIASTGAQPAFASLTSSGSTITVTGGAGTLNIDVTAPLTVANGGTGATTFTAHSLLLGEGTSAVTALGAASNGQLPIGSTGADPVLATLTAGAGISITNGAGSITIAASDLAIAYTNVPHSSSPYTVLSTDYYLSVDCSGGVVTIKLPNAPTTNQIFIVKDRTGNAATNNITVTTVGGSVTIDGVTSFVMDTNYQSINVLFNGTSYEIF